MERFFASKREFFLLGQKNPKPTLRPRIERHLFTHRQKKKKEEENDDEKKEFLSRDDDDDDARIVVVSDDDHHHESSVLKAGRRRGFDCRSGAKTTVFLEI